MRRFIMHHIETASNMHSIEHYGSSDFVTFYNAQWGNQEHLERNTCELLDINRLTLRKYLAHEKQPSKAMVRLLFMESNYGHQTIHCKLFNEARMYASMSESLKKTVSALREQLQATEAKLEELKANSHDDAANSDYFAPGSRFTKLNQWRENLTEHSPQQTSGTNSPAITKYSPPKAKWNQA